MPDVEWNRRTWSTDLREFARTSARRTEHFYGSQWGEPAPTGLRGMFHRLLGRDRRPDLTAVLERYLRPFATPDASVVEIGPGGGRWTEHLLRAREVTVVDVNPEFFPYLRQRFARDLERLRFYETSGYELGGIPTASADFVFTFGVFVHIDADGIRAYLGEIERVLRHDGVAVVQYADKTKSAARANRGFSDMTPARMHAMLAARAFTLLAHDTTLLHHSSIAVLQKGAAPGATRAAPCP
ncbi:MAG: class I SAM-dependent methyltransferase [Candidatus Binatia bacterium]